METKMAKVNVDVASDCPVGIFLESVGLHGGKISGFAAIGPAGGNPNVTIDFDTTDEAMAFLRKHYPQDDEDFLEGYIL